MFALVDANSFYCSAEQVFRPDWRGKPIVVLSNNDGCIVAANRQAKEAGVKKFAPYFQMKALCEKKGVIALSSNYELYGSLSADMMDVIGRFAPEQHIYSIDETFLSFRNCYPAIPCLTKHASVIRRAVWKETRLPVCVGIGATLTLAKAANHAAKKVKGYNGVCHIRNTDQRIEILKGMTTSDVWGIGARTSQRLTLMNVKTAFDLSRMPTALARKNFNIEVERTVRELNGEICKEWDEARADKKQIFSTRSMGERVTDKVAILQALSKHASIAAAKARQQGLLCKVLQVFACNSPFDENPTGFKHTFRFAFPTNDSTVLIQACSAIVNSMFKPNVRYYKVGVGLLDLCSEKNLQQDLFLKEKNPRLMGICDELNTRYGADSIFVAAQGTVQKWSMKRELLSPQYTTCWNDIPDIQC